MPPSIFINLPIKDLTRTNAFFQQLGFSFNEKFSNEQATCMIINEQAFAMLLQTEFFKGFIKTDISDAFKATEVLLAIDKESKEAVDQFVDQAITLGALEARDSQDLGFMYSRSFHDPDGHIWEVFWMDPDSME
jgi:predicted lactoylglutathione lyase